MNKEKMLKASKILVIIFMCLTFTNVLLPDEFVIGIANLDYRLSVFSMLIRWFNFVAFLALPVAVFFDRATMKRVSIYFCLPVVIIFTCMFGEVIKGYTSDLGTGIVDIRYLPEWISILMRNGVFRGILFFATNLIEIAVIVLLILRDYKILKFNKTDVLKFISLLPALIISIIPAYALEGIFDTDTGFKFKMFTIAQLVWIVFLISEIIVLYNVFKKKSEEDRYILILILSLSLLVQFNQLFSSLGELTCKRMPFQLCNIASYIYLFAVLKRNRQAYIFNATINVVGALIAIIVMDSNTNGILDKGNIHYIVEHSNILVIPILGLLLGVIEPFKKEEYKVFLKWFSIYFLFVFVLGTTFNAIYKATGSDYFKCNYLFMFDSSVAGNLLPFTKPLFDIQINIGPVTIYPLIAPLIYVVLSGLGMLVFVIFRHAIPKSYAPKDVSVEELA